MIISFSTEEKMLLEDINATNQVDAFVESFSALFKADNQLDAKNLIEDAKFYFNFITYELKKEIHYRDMEGRFYND